jgi:15-cis-phytoene synthase
VIDNRTSMLNPQLDATQVIQVHSRSFAMASRLLPRRVRQDVVGLYAWCRSCDDAVDRATERKSSLKKLANLKEDIFRIQAGQTVRQPESQWLQPVILRYSIPIQIPLDFLEGMEADLGQPKLEDEAQLLRYCYQAAGTVGLMMCQVLGAKHEAAGSHAKSLGIAMQLTNIARDVGEDWRMGRRYLPKSWIPLDPSANCQPSDRQVRDGVRQALSLAELHYRHGLEGLQYLPVRTRPAIRVAAAVYREIGRQIEHEDWSVMTRRAVVPTRRKWALVLRSLGQEFYSGWIASKRLFFKKWALESSPKNSYAGEIGR